MTPDGPVVLRAACILVLLLLVGVPADAQTRRIDGGSASFKAFSFFWETRLVPPAPPLSDNFSAGYSTTLQNEVHRILLDGGRRVYFGYTVRIEPTAESTRFRLTFRPLSLTPDLRTRFAIDATWKPMPTPRFPAFQVVRSGEVLELSLLTNEASAQRLIEYVTVQEPGPSRGFQQLPREERELVVAPGTPRDFTIEDAVLHLQDARLYVNGRADDPSQQMLGDKSGSIVWIYVPNRGRFLLSIARHARHGFRRAGEIRGSSLRFTIGAETYSVSTAGRIAPGDAPFNLYVLHQPKWRPGYPHADLEAASIGAADRVEDVIGK